MRHDSPQGERIGFWFHLGFAAMYALAFAWHLKGAREHARDAKPKPVQMPTDWGKAYREHFGLPYGVGNKKLQDYADAHIGAYADHDPKVGEHIDHCVRTGENFFQQRRGKRPDRDI